MEHILTSFTGSSKKNLSYITLRLKNIFSRNCGKLILEYERFRVRKILTNSKEIVLIYSIGKVGSSTLYNSIKKSIYVGAPVFHIHSLNPARIDCQKQYYKESKRKSIPYHLLKSTAITESLGKYQGKIKVITMIREPLSRELSSVYQDSINFTKSRKIPKYIIQQAISEKFTALIKMLPEDLWFEMELKKIFGIDIYKLNFRVELGFAIMKSDELDFALIRMEDLNDRFSEVMGHLFQEGDKIKMSIVNESRNKYYHDSYQSNKNDVGINSSDFIKLKKSLFIQTFYPDYINSIHDKWVKS